MKNRNIKREMLLVSFLLFSILFQIAGQISPVNQLMKQIENNNLELKAQKQWLEKQLVATKTGIYPENPRVEYGYFPGNTEAIGVKQTFGVTQSFDFPTVYSTRFNVARQQMKLAENAFKESSQYVLLNAKLCYYKLVYLNKQHQEITKRYNHAAGMLRSYQAQFNQGQISILALNKARIQHLSQRKEYILNNQKIQNELNNLTMLNGGLPVTLSDTSYAPNKPIPIDSLEQTLMTYHPTLLKTSLELQLSKMETRAAKQSWLPGLEAGYESEAVDEEVFRGIKAGISIPLWRDKNKVSVAKVNESYTEAMAGFEKNKLLAEMKNQINQLKTMEATLVEYRKTLKEVNKIDLLNKALNLGEISIVDYFTELAFYYSIVDEFLALEYEYHNLLAKHRSFLLP